MAKQPPQTSTQTLNPRRPMPRTALSALLPLMLAQVQPAQADCSPPPSAGADTIACSGSTTTPVEGGAGNDSIANSGTVSVAATESQSSPPSLPDFSEFGSDDADYELRADSTAISGGAGDDTLDNSGTSTANSSAALQSISAPVTLAGGDVVSATNTIDATATGIAGDAGAGGITSTGQVHADATAELLSVNVEHNFADTTRGSVTTQIDAQATGIASGEEGGWALTNQGDVTAQASASSDSTNIEVNLADSAVADAELLVTATATALATGTGSGTLTNGGNLTVLSKAESDDISVNMSYLDITLVDPKPADGGTTVTALGTGIDGRHAVGTLTVGNSGVIDVMADAQADSLTIALASEGTPQGLQSLFEGPLDEKEISDISVTAVSDAAGVAAGSGADALGNTGVLRVNAESAAYQNSINVGISLIDWKIPTPGIVLGSAGTGALADAVGMDGGAGNDRIDNSATVESGSYAKAQAVTVSANISGFTDNPLGGGSLPLLGSLGASLALADTITNAQADSVGLRGNDGSDSIANSGRIDARAETDGNAISATASVNVKYKEGDNLFSANAVGARAMTLAEATAIGIDGGDANYHQDTPDEDKPSFAVDDDVITNAGTIDASAETEVLTVAASIEVAGTVKAAGVTVNLAATDTSAIGFATAVGVDGGGGRDQVSNSGTLIARADADATAGSGSLQVGFAKQGAVVGASLARAEAVADARSAGIRGGEGDDTLVNRERIEAHANADSLAVAVAVSLSGTADGVSIAGSIADASGDALASATGIDGGADNDSISNENVIDVSDVTASSLAASISLEVAGTNNDVAAGISIADSSANATTTAIGLDGGDGNDRIINNGAITLRQVRAETDAIGVAVSLNAALNAGVAAGGAMTDTSTHSSTVATGIAGGSGNDTILNTGTVVANSDIGADASSVSASLSANLSMAGAALSAALADTSTHAETTLAGVDGGSGDDVIDNRGAITLRGDSAADGLAIAVSISAALGVGADVSLVDGTSEASTTVTGIDGGSGRNDILNAAHLDVGSSAGADALGVTVGAELAFGAGLTVADVEANATATAIGIGERGAPAVTGTQGRITNTGRIDVAADSEVSGTTVSVALRGKSLGETSTNALADAYGVKAGEGNNTIDNRGVIAVTSTADASGLSVAANLAGQTEGDANVTADARVSGITSGAGDDLVQNTAAMTLDAISSADASAISVTLAGTATADAKSTASADATAFDGGLGNDQFLNEGSLLIHASSSTHANNLTVAVSGTTAGDVTNTPTSQALALNGGVGNDTVVLGGATVSVTADANADVSASSWSVAGTSGSRAGVEAQSTALALRGGSGDDTLLQRAGQLTIAANAQASADSVAWSIFGGSGADAALTARSRAAGLDGGAGNDLLRNETAFIARAESTLNATGGGKTIFGNAGTSTDIGATATTIGITAGDGNDRIENQAALTLSALATVNSDRVSISFAGSPDINELLKASSAVTGLDGGDGDDVIVNTAAITATATARATTNGAARTTLGGGTSSSGKAVAGATATGISGGIGTDIIDNRGALVATALIAPRTNNDSSAGVFFGDGQVEGRSLGTLSAAGIDADDGDNTILNRADLTVTAATTADASSNTHADGSDFSFGFGGNANSFTATEIEATAAGIRARNGANQVLNTGAIGVHLENTIARAYTDPNGGSTSGDGNGDIQVLVSGRGRGIELGDGNAVVINQGSIDVNASPVARGESDADGTAQDDANSYIYASAFGEAKGISAGNGNHRISSSGAIHVTAAPVAMSHADVDGGHTLGGATGRSDNYSTARAYGIDIGDGSTRIENHALLSVLAAPQARPIGDRNVAAIGYTDGDANAYTYSQSVGEAVGLRTGVGTFNIENTDTIEVSANAVASGGYYVDPGSGVNGHADSSTALYAEGRAWGIWTGGTLDIHNSGNILVSALPTVNIAFEDGDGGPYHYRETWGTAAGIDATRGGGNQNVINDGFIVARASASAFADDNGGGFDPTSLRIGGAPYAVGVDLRGDGFKSVVNNGTISATADLSTAYFGTDPFQALFATAVSVAGDGARVVNNGTITARRSFFGLIEFNGYAVYLASNGNQAVELSLGRNSVTTGNVAMLGGSATLELEGTPVLNGVFEVNPGRDFNLVLNNDGSFAHALPTVAHVTRNGAGVFSLPALNTVRTMTLNEGTLSLASGYTFSPTGQLHVAIQGDGDASGLQATGAVHLDGTLTVTRDDGLYTDGTRYRVISASAVDSNSAFDAIHLPDATALVSFSSQQSANAFDVLAHVGSFASVAGAGNRHVMAESLDALAQNPSEAMRLQLSRIQGLSSDELQRTYASLGPVVHAFGTTAAFNNFNQYDEALWQRLFDPVLGAGSATVSAANGGRQLAGADDASTPESGLWLRGFHREGDRDAGDTTTAYDYEQSGYGLGYDRPIGDFIVGASLGEVDNEVIADGLAGSTLVTSRLYSIYGSYSRSGYYLDGIATYGNNDFSHQRQIAVGSSIAVAAGTHEGKVFAAGMNGGRLFERGQWVFGPYASLQYTRQREDGFTESGGDLSAVVAGRTAQSLVSTLGGRIGLRVPQGNGEWLPEFAIAWLHDHALDGRDITASYVGAPDITFIVDGEQSQRDALQAGLGVSYRMSGFAARLTYRAEYRDGFNSSGFFGGLQFVF